MIARGDVDLASKNILGLRQVKDGMVCSSECFVSTAAEASYAVI